MSGSNLEFRSKPNALPTSHIWTLALDGRGASQTCYLTRLLQIDNDRWVGLVGDYSILAGQIRMAPEIDFSAMSDDGHEIQGVCKVSVWGRLDELSSDKQTSLKDVMTQLKWSQQFAADDMVLIEVKVCMTERVTSLPSRTIKLRT